MSPAAARRRWAWAILRALPGNAREASGAIRLGADRLTGMDASGLARIRGRRVSMVFQDPSTALNPTLTLGRQMTEVLRRHRGMDQAAAWAEAMALLRRVEIAAPESLLRRYPHEASGGEKQRVVIATAFACRPELVVLDEPTTALDVITGARVLDMLRRLRAETGVAALYISHDLGLVARIADRVAVLQRGRVVEQAPAATVFRTPADAYTRALVAAVPRPSVRLVDTAPGQAELLGVTGLGVAYVRKRLFGSARSTVVQDVSLTVRDSEIVGLVGESGSGKSSLARAVTGLTPYSGQIALRGQAVRRMDGAYRRAVQIVFQHPDATLNPRHRVADILARPLRLFGGARAEIPRLLEQVALPASFASTLPASAFRRRETARRHRPRLCRAPGTGGVRRADGLAGCVGPGGGGPLAARSAQAARDGLSVHHPRS